MKTYLTFVLGIVLGIVIGFVIFTTTPIGQRYHVYEFFVKYNTWSGEVYKFDKGKWVQLPNDVVSYKDWQKN